MKVEDNLEKTLFSNVKNYDQSVVIRSFMIISFFNFLIAMAKGHRYQSSWCKKGLLSISQNLERKYSRMDNMLFPENSKPLQIERLNLGGSDDFLDTISDEANYCNLGLTFFLLKSGENVQIQRSFDSFLSSQAEFIKDNFKLNEIDKNYFSVFFEEFQNNFIQPFVEAIKERDQERFNIYISKIIRTISDNSLIVK